MKIKNKLTEKDFDNMGWHDNYIHSISFPNENLNLILDIDYIFKWILNKDTNLYDFLVSPCKLVFKNVFDLKIDLNFENFVGLYIQDIYLFDSSSSLNTKVKTWDFEITTDKGIIKFNSSGYEQTVERQPILSKSQVLERNF